jgi:NarL family two-component system response regulator LiaR
MEVLQCIAEGLSNMDIAARLNISDKTVKSHVGNILSKLYLTDRTKAAVYAWREGIVKK